MRSAIHAASQLSGRGAHRCGYCPCTCMLIKKSDDDDDDDEKVFFHKEFFLIMFRMLKRIRSIYK